MISARGYAARNAGSIVFGFLLYFAGFAAAVPSTADEPYTPNPMEYAPEESVKCDWSKLNSEDLRVCRKKKEYFDKMSKEEKKKYNAKVDKVRIEESIKRLDRRTR